VPQNPPFEEASARGCHIVYLKGPGIESCMLQEFAAHVLTLTVYDRATNGTFKYSDQVEVQSWYERAQVHYADPLQAGSSMAFVESEGNTGTGTLQMLLSVWAWTGTRLTMVLLEPLSYTLSDGRRTWELGAQYQIAPQVRGQGVVIRYSYRGSGERSLHWEDAFRWNPGQARFLPPSRRGTTRPNWIRRNIENVRRRTTPRLATTKTLDLDLMSAVGIMDILSR